MKRVILFFILIEIQLCTLTNFAQVSQQEWISIYNGPGNNYDEAHSIAVDGLGNVYVTGASKTGIAAGSEDFTTIKYDAAGVEQWISRYNGPGNGYDEAFDIAVDDSGNVYVTGFSLGTGTGYDYATVKYNSAGVQQWASRYNGTGNNEDKAASLVIDYIGNVYVTGYSRNGSTTATQDYATVKYNTYGVEQWAVRYEGPGNELDQASSIAVDNLGNVYVTGWSTLSGTNWDYATIKYNSSGVQQWVERYNGAGNGNDLAHSIVVNDSGNVYVTGESWGGGTHFDYATIKYDSLGSEKWVSRYNGSGNNEDRAYDLAIDGLGNVYITGYSYGAGLTYLDYATVKYNTLGFEQWVARYNGPGDNWDQAYSIAVDGSGNVYVTGLSYGSGTARDYATIKYNSIGSEQWVQRYNGPGMDTDLANSLAIDGSDNVYVTGRSIGDGANYDYATIKYSQTPTNVYQATTDLPENYSLLQNYPNPFNPSTKISFVIPSGARNLVKLKVFDLLGNEIATLVDEYKDAGSYEVEFDARNHSSGIYLYKLKAGNFIQTRKMIYLK